ncbi:MAG: hypothetical protein HYZ21_06465 [Chloroflexi bacterium]|nr:hypothetical protein [Chloroflexota bacterium]
MTIAPFVFSSATPPRTNPPREADELYQKLRAEPWINPWLDEEELFPSIDWNLEIILRF